MSTLFTPTSNQTTGSIKFFDAFREASDFEREMSDANFPHDNYFVKMFFADDEATAAAKADAMRPFPKGAGKA